MADIKVVELETRPIVVHKSVVDTLEVALEMAKKGQIKAVAVAYVFDDFSTGHAWSASECAPTLIGAMSIATRRIIER